LPVQLVDYGKGNISTTEKKLWRHVDCMEDVRQDTRPTNRGETISDATAYSQERLSRIYAVCTLLASAFKYRRKEAAASRRLHGRRETGYPTYKSG